MERICIKCKINKDEMLFKTKSICIDCNKLYQLNYRSLNRDKILLQITKWRNDNLDYQKSKKDEWWTKNRDASLKRRRKYYHENKEAISKKNKAKRALNKDIIRPAVNKRRKERRKTNIQYRLQHNLRSRLNISIRNNAKVGSAISDLGCSISELKTYLESLFKPGMTWNNWSYEGWHIDHKKPLSLFDLSNPEQFKDACHYTNLQPLWAADNLKKSNKFSE